MWRQVLVVGNAILVLYKKGATCLRFLRFTGTPVACWCHRRPARVSWLPITWRGARVLGQTVAFCIEGPTGTGSLPGERSSGGHCDLVRWNRSLPPQVLEASRSMDTVFAREMVGCLAAVARRRRVRAMTS